MKRSKVGYGLVLGAIALGAAQAVACSTDFGSCGASRSCPSPDTGGDAGDSSSAGRSSGSTSQPTTSGDARVGAGESGAGGASASESGAGGEGGAAEPAALLFGACSSKGQVVCEGHAAAERLACDGTTWQAGTTCAADQLCNSLDGRCMPTVAECVAAAPGSVVCRGDQLLTCGADLVTATEGVTCRGLCKNGVCQAPACGDKKVEAGEDCDDGGASSSSGACVKCKTATCGDGALYVGHEQCDDKNLLAGDGCSATCKAEPVALALGDNLTCVLSSTGVVKCWGRNERGALGLGDTIDRGGHMNEVPSQLPAVDLGANRKAVAIAAGFASVCAILDNGDLKCWGANGTGQLGTGDTADRGDGPGEMADALKPIALGVGRTTKSVSIDAYHTCAVLDDGSVKCWGSGMSGELGQGSLTDYFSPGLLPSIPLGRAAKAVSASNFDTCALLDNGSAKCWGLRNYVSASGSADLDSDGIIGDFAGETAALPALNWGAGHSASSIAAGSVNCAVLNDATLKCWGQGYEGQLGQPGGNLGSTPEELATLNGIDLGKGRTAKTVVVQHSHVCAVLDNGQLKCWGFNGSGQLGLGTTASVGDAPGDMGDNLHPVNLGGHAVHQVAAGLSHTCAILDDGTLKCWGSNDSGQLGLGDTLARGTTGGAQVVNPSVDLSF